MYYNGSMRFFFRGAIILLLVLSLSGCSAGNIPVSKADFCLDTVVSIAIYDRIPEQESGELLEQCFGEIRRYEDLFSAEKEGSDVSLINDSHGKEVKVSSETAELIDIALQYSEESHGAFDITIRPVSVLWDFKSGKGVPPDKEDIEEALKHVGYEHVILNKADCTVRLDDPEAGIDLGGIAKGYIADRIKDFLKEKGINSAIINLGGNVLLVGSKPDGSDFKVGIEKPFSDGEMIDELALSDCSVVTSGNYERYFYYDDKLYHHILDTSTGYPAESGLNGITVVSERSVDGDALSTACFCLSHDGAEELLKRKDNENIRVYFIDSDNNLIK